MLNIGNLLYNIKNSKVVYYKHKRRDTMSYFTRVFSLAEDFPSLYALCDELLEAGFEFATAPGKGESEFEESDWKSMVFQYDENCKPILLERNVKGEAGRLLEEEQQEFLEVLEAMPFSKAQKKAVDILKYSVQIYAFEIQEDITEKGWDFLECIMDFLCDATDGYVQVDEEGIYDKEGKILIEME